ncbi:HK97 gp10 family phage protein [Rosistilla oblonga]|uniref:Phage protein, HK97 gp10 family n=1 Tax=Rosistilla oblonga TaxID=2527990 RepID=A0A518ITU9_9BACT|nr:HK97 gp10 family phage protein [Rosistilla oblonga]QDV56513.1 hypothetical protein Mal33_25040 [Rosistilla oblonga]
MSKTKVNVTIDESGDVDRLLQTMPDVLQHKQLPKALRAGAKPIIRDAKQRVSQPGYPGDKPGKEPLKNTIHAVIRKYEYTSIAVVGCTWPDGNHGWLVEFGHDITRTKGGPVFGHVPPYPFMRPAIDATRSEVAGSVLLVLQMGVREFNSQ